MSTLQVFDKPLCCSSGVCGPDVDPALVTFSADLQWLERQGVQVQRINPAHQPTLFAASELVREELKKHGSECLPRGCGERCGCESGRLPKSHSIGGLDWNHARFSPRASRDENWLLRRCRRHERLIVLVLLLTCLHSEVENASLETADTTAVFHRQGWRRQDILGLCHGGCTCGSRKEGLAGQHRSGLQSWASLWCDDWRA